MVSDYIQYVLPLSLMIGWILDLKFGDPARLPHPIVYMGRWVAFWEKRLNRGSHRRLKGGVLAVTSVLLVFALAWGVLALLAAVVGRCSDTAHASAIGIAAYALMLGVSAAMVFFCLAGKTLRSEVAMVFDALERGIDDGRRQVARIVGRDTQSLSAQEVATASLETLAENLSDGVVAPLFWFVLLGVPGMLAYKMVNTLDSMIGYKTSRYREFGCVAAHIDDVANYLPARLTALLLAMAGWVYSRWCRLLKHRSLAYYLGRTLKYSSCHASPNSGWPEAALSAFLDCRFGGAHDYFGELVYKPYIGDNARPITYADMRSSIRLCFIVEVVSLLLGMTVVIF